MNKPIQLRGVRKGGLRLRRYEHSLTESLWCSHGPKVDTSQRALSRSMDKQVCLQQTPLSNSKAQTIHAHATQTTLK